jgi:hypothetical protein
MAVAFTRVTSSRRGTSTCEAARLVFVVLPMRFPRARASLSTAPSGGNPNGWGVAEPAWWLNLQAAPQAVVELAGARSIRTSTRTPPGARARRQSSSSSRVPSGLSRLRA